MQDLDYLFQYYLGIFEKYRILDFILYLVNYVVWEQSLRICGLISFLDDLKYIQV